MPIFGIPGSLRGDRGGGRNEEDRSIKECRLFEYASLKKPFAGRVVCGLCDRAFGRRIWNSTDDRLRRVMWQCSAKYEIKGIRVATINIFVNSQSNIQIAMEVDITVGNQKKLVWEQGKKRQ